MMKNSTNTMGLILLGFFIAVGLIGSSYIISTTVLKVKNMERTVSVKGLAERQVKADIAIYPIQFTVAGNDPSKLFEQIKRNKNTIVSFLKSLGFTDREIFISPPDIVDNYAEGYNPNVHF